MHKNEPDVSAVILGRVRGTDVWIHCYNPYIWEGDWTEIYITLLNGFDQMNTQRQRSVLLYWGGQGWIDVAGTLWTNVNNNDSIQQTIIFTCVTRTNIENWDLQAHKNGLYLIFNFILQRLWVWVKIPENWKARAWLWNLMGAPVITITSVDSG